MYSRVTPKDFFGRGRSSLVPVRELVQQQRQALGNLGMVARRMQAGKRRMCKDVDR
jgi:hypothetical protein